MLVAYHNKYDETNVEITSETEILDENLYDVQKRKKNKLITELRTEKVIDPSLRAQADDAIDDISKCKMGAKTVGNVSYYYTFLKGFYFYIHKIVRHTDGYANSVHMYCVSHGDTKLFKQIMEIDPLFSKED